MNNNDQIRNQIYLAGLLHDIGKFYQRTDDKSASKSELLSEDIKNTTSSLCPEYKGQYSRKHVLYTAQFVDRIIMENGHFDLNRNDLMLFRLSSAHHSPSTFYEQIIQLADHLSAGLDRDDAPEKEPDIEIENDPERFKKVRMRSIFEELFTDGNLSFSYELPLGQTDIYNSKSIFPQESFDEEIPDYKHLWKEFNNEINKIKGGNIRSFSENLLSVLETFTSTIPSSTIHLPDVSLYDHLKTTAAFSICLFDYAKEKGISEIKDFNSTSPFLLIGGDVSGIQNFIYDIISKSAAKNLKGRSFYINLLIENILQEILSELNLFYGNLVYGTGGKFYIIAPNTKKVKQKLTNIKSKITNELLEKHTDELYLALSTVEFGFDLLTNDDPGKLWKELNDNLSKEKMHKFSDVLHEYFTLFKPDDVSEYEQDRISGKLIHKNDGTKTKGDLFVEKETTAAYVKLGQILKTTGYIVYTDKNGSIKDNEISGLLGKKFRFIRKEQSSKELPKTAKSDRVICLNNVSKLLASPDLISTNIWYGGNKYPTDSEGHPVSFDELAGEKDDNFRRLGVLKMDVDSLGKAFISGLPKNKRNFSAYSTMSRRLDMFFSGYLNKIQQEKRELSGSTYILYSGGDDLVIIGKWNYIIEMAEIIRNDFRRFTCYNPNLSLSGGISVVTHKYPILKAIEDADDGETKAKNHTVNGKKKDSITLLGMPLKWDTEFKIVKELKKDISGFVKNEKLPKSFISRIRNYTESSKFDDKGNMKNVQALWMSAYELQRLKKSIRNNDEDVKDFIEEVKENIYTNKHNKQAIESNYHLLQLLDIACRWSELEIRTKN